jgi:hypothetical protein
MAAMDNEAATTSSREPFVWVPAQHKQPEIIDYRAAKTTKKGYKERCKRKLEEMQEQVEQDQQEAEARMEDDSSPAAAEEGQSSKRRKVEDGMVKHIPVSAASMAHSMHVQPLMAPLHAGKPHASKHTQLELSQDAS